MAVVRPADLCRLNFFCATVGKESSEHLEAVAPAKTVTP